MRICLVTLVLACASPAAHATYETAQPANVDDFLYAIRMVESGNRYLDCPSGRNGEQGPYQFRREVWRQYTHAPFVQARTGYADEVARMHYQWLANQLRENGCKPTFWAVAAAWNGGIDAVVSGRIRSSTRGYATRVVNLVQDEAKLRASLTPKYRIALAGNN